MYKKFLSLLAVVFISSCSHDAEFVHYCPNVAIIPIANRVTRIDNDQTKFRAEIIGYEGFCRYDEKKRGTYATIYPIFEIIRYVDTYDNKLEFAYFSDTGDNQTQSLGKQPHYETAYIKEKGEKVIHKGKAIEVRIPNDNPGYKVKLGISLNDSEYKHNLKQGLKY